MMVKQELQAGSAADANKVLQTEPAADTIEEQKQSLSGAAVGEQEPFTVGEAAEEGQEQFPAGEAAEEQEQFSAGEAAEEQEQFQVSEAMAGTRLDRILAKRFSDVSRSYLQRLIRDGHVLLNQKAAKAGAKPSAGDTVEFFFPEMQELQVEPEPIPLDLVINKPKGMVIHPAPGHYSGTLVNALMYHCRDSLSGINGVLRPGIVHRIDQNTTGSLLVCKNDAAHQAIAEQLRVHSVTRTYRAIVHGRLSEDGTVHTTIGRHPLRRMEMSVNVPNGREAVTHYHILEQFDRFTYIECRLETGRTHQIRVHMKSIGHPVLGDDLYGPSKCPFPGLQGQTLHAMTIGFIHPSSGKYVEVSAPLPVYFEELLRRLRG